MENTIALLKEKNFGLLIGGQLISQLGENLNKVALLWFVYQLTRDAAPLAWIGILQTLPPLLFGWLTGVVLDRTSKKTMMLRLDTIRGFLVLLIPILYYTHHLSLGVLYPLVFLIAVTSGIFGPALYSSIPDIVPQSRIVQANAMMQTTGQIGLLLGPIIGGLLVTIWNPAAVMIINGITFLISALFLAFIRIPWTPPTSALSVASFFRETGEGFRFVFSPKTGFMGLFMAMTVYGLITGPLNIILPVFAKHSIHGGSQTFGVLIASLGIGMVLSSLFLTFVPVSNFGRWIRNAFLGGGILLGALSLVHSIPLAVALLAAAGTAISFVNPLLHSVIQKQTPPELLARTFSTMSIGFLVGIIAGMSVLPAFLHRLGSSETMLALGAILFTGALSLSASLMRITGTDLRESRVHSASSVSFSTIDPVRNDS
jgi:DHA3 family macrolide efflux protein-like MFS transporter